MHRRKDTSYIEWRIGLRSHVKDREGGGWVQDQSELNYNTDYNVILQCQYRLVIQWQTVARQCYFSFSVEIPGSKMSTEYIVSEMAVHVHPVHSI